MWAQLNIKKNYTLFIWRFG